VSTRPSDPAAAGAVIDPIELARNLIRCPSVTPAEAGALDLLQARLEVLGFACHRLRFSEPGTEEVDNLYARLGTAGQNFCFAGHTDVVPVGDADAWSVDPFEAVVVKGNVFGRGAADMKGAVAAFVAAAARFIAARGVGFGGSISLLITGDEEGPGVNGTVKVLDWLAGRGERLDACLVGEPTNPRELGDMVKIGRRGSLNATLTVDGVQGHTAYPHLADNPVHRLVQMLDAVTRDALDDGSEFFEPSTVQVTTIDVDNPATNVIPGRARATMNIRYNDRHDSDAIVRWMRQRFDVAGERYTLDVKVSGDSFLTPPGPLSDLVCAAVERVAGRRPSLGTAGGTSDARFIKDHCPVVEFGLVGATMHKIDECAAIGDILGLTEIYHAVLDGFFAPTGGASPS